MKTCSKDGCMAMVFSKGLCLKHWKMEYQKPIPTSLKRPNKFSSKRKKLTKDYHEIIKKNDSNNIMPVCFFCGRPIKGVISHHHLLRRDGDNLIDERYIVNSHNECHVDMYHSKSVDILVTLPWYEGFLTRLREIDDDRYWNEVFKQVKAGLMTMEQFNQMK